MRIATKCARRQLVARQPGRIGSRLLLLLFVLGTLQLGAFGQSTKPVAQLPLVYLDTTWNPPTGGTTWAAHTTAQLNSAIASSQPGDTIVLDAGATYTGNFTLPAKTNPSAQWIYIVSSQLAALPAGTRVSPSDAVNMAKIVSPNVTAPITVGNGANYWRLAGLEITANSNFPSGCPGNGQNCMTYFLMNIKAFSTPADYVWLDRCYAHGSPTQDLQGGIIINWNHAAIVDSYLDDIHIKGFDSVGAGAYYTLGPIKIVNNYIAASTENIMFGGSGGNTNPGVPSDIEIRNNYLFKPLSWVPLNMTNHSMVVKNCFEVKSGQRILFDGNTCENVWAGGQVGYAVVLTVRTSQSGDMAVDNDITITNNVFENVTSFVNGGAKDDQCANPSYPYKNCKNAGSQDRWNIANNLVTFFDPTALGGFRNVGIAFGGGYDHINNVPGTIRDVIFQHNTLVSNASHPCWNSIYFSSNGQPPPFKVPLSNNVWIQDNALCNQPTGDWGYFGSSLPAYMGLPNTSPNDFTARFSGNVIWIQPGHKTGSYPATNMTQSAPFTYINPSALDYQLLTPVWTNTSDGQEAGINNSLLP